MNSLNELKRNLKKGAVYRRAELGQWSNAVDRHLTLLQEEGFLEKLSPGLYYVPSKSAFGNVPAEEQLLVKKFLKDDDFLLTSPNAYNTLGVGTTQLYNKRIVYNHKRHGEFELGGRKFFFHAKHKFPKVLNKEFLLVDLVNNLKNLAENQEQIFENVCNKVPSMDLKKLNAAVMHYGNVKTKALLFPLLNKSEV